MIKPYVLPIAPEVYTSHNDIGIFDRLYEIDGIDHEQRDVLAQWLCNNCTTNFIMVELSTRIVAGGTTDLVSSWLYRSETEDTLRSYQIKLHSEDVMLFELCWLGHG